MGNSANARTGSAVLAGRTLRIFCVIAPLMMAAIPALAESPVSAHSPNQNATSHKHPSVEVEVTVVDPTDAVIRKAKVTLLQVWHRHSCLCEIVPLEGSTNRQECRCQTAQNGNDPGTIAAATDWRGVAHFRRLSKESYRIIVEAPGFNIAEQMVTLKKAEHIRVKLQIAVKTEIVEVAATPVLVDTVVNLTSEPLPYVPYVQFPLNPVHMAVLGS